MEQSHYERMLALADEVFATKHDPNQLDVDEEVIEQLLAIHPYSVSEEADENGPIAWLILIPTSLHLMELFLKKEITERELFEQTKLMRSFEAIYMCSALVLEEYRRKGISKKLSLNAIAKMRSEHAIKALFIWAFTDEGDKASEEIARLEGLPLYRREV
jgi:GNAT superfamily N-acetyltransferase